nr:alpha/beta hydrolase [Deltaproteobacteria bacterium]
MRIVRLLLCASVGYALLCLFACGMQRRILYHPDSFKPSPAQLNDIGLGYWPSEGDSFRGFVNTPALSPGADVIVIFHGNAGNAWQRGYYPELLGPLGYRVVLAEYAGYGGRPGDLTEESLVADGKETVRLASQQYEGKLYVCGESMGVGVASAVAADDQLPISGVIAITPWDSLASVAQSKFWFLPVRWLLQDTYDNVQNLNRFDGPVAVIVAEHDEVIPVYHGLRLYESLSGEKKLWTISGAQHNTWPDIVDQVWWQEIMTFVTESR